MAIQDIKLDELKQLFEMATDIAHVGYWEWDIQTNDVLWARQKIEIYGEDSDSFVPTFEKFLNVIDAETKERVLKEIDDVLSSKKKYYDLQHKIKLTTGKVAWVHEKAFVIYAEDKTPLRMVGIVYDITENVIAKQKLENSYEHANHLKHYDQLTNLYNKYSLMSDIDAYIKNDESFSLLFLDIDNFKVYDNTYGHIFGDILLQEVSVVLKSTLSNVKCYRYSADEYVVILKDSELVDDALKNIKLKFIQPLSISEILVHITFCIGIARFPKDGNTSGEIIKNANIALQLGKNIGTGQTLFYESYMSDEMSKQHLLLESLVESIQSENFTPFYQPKINAITNEIVSFEALVRWRRYDEYIPPALFLSLAVEHDLINGIDLIMLKKSLEQLKTWHQQGFKISVSVNFTNGDFESVEVFGLLQKYKEYLRYLIIEVTENELMSLSKSELEYIGELKNLGIKISLDDFGTGYSSLQYIHKLPLDELKIDKTFVDNIPGSKKDEDIVKIIKSIADTFELHCVVEGVENKEQLEFFKELNLTTIQGYYFSKPLPAVEATQALVDNV